MPKVMIVEDDNSLREIYSTALQAEGYEVVSAADGEEALATAVKEKPDLLILDVMMPKISGFDVLDIMRSTPETKNAKIMMMTALSQQSDKERGERLGADRYLVKSQVSVPDVVINVQQLLEDGPHRDPADAGPIVGAGSEPIKGPDLPVGSYQVNSAPDQATPTQNANQTPSAAPQPAIPQVTQAPAPTPTSTDDSNTHTDVDISQPSNVAADNTQQAPPQTPSSSISGDPDLDAELDELPSSPQPATAAQTQDASATVQPPATTNTPSSPAPADQTLAEISEAAAAEAAAQAFEVEAANSAQTPSVQVPAMTAPPNAQEDNQKTPQPVQPITNAPTDSQDDDVKAVVEDDNTESTADDTFSGNDLTLPDEIKKQIEEARSEASAQAEPSAQESNEVTQQIDDFAQESASSAEPSSEQEPAQPVAEQDNTPAKPNISVSTPIQQPPRTDTSTEKAAESSPQAPRNSSSRTTITPPDRPNKLPPTADGDNPLESASTNAFQEEANADDTNTTVPSMPGDTVNPGVNESNKQTPSAPAQAAPAPIPAEPQTEQPEQAQPPQPQQQPSQNQTTPQSDSDAVNPHDISL